MNPKQLLLARYADIAQLVLSREEIKTLDLASVLRQVLVDKHSLIHAANTNKISIRFRVGFHGEIDFTNPLARGLTFSCIQDGLDPNTSSMPRDRIVEISDSQFLQHIVLYALGEYYTVKQIIKFASNIEGGRHYDPTPEKEYARLRKFAEVFGISGLPLACAQVKAIGRVTLTALKPLIEDIQKTP